MSTVPAVQVVELAGPAGLRDVHLPEPRDPDSVVVEVFSAGVSFPDLLMSRGEYQRKPALPFVPGVEVAGRVYAAPAGSMFRTGDRVAGFVRVGGWAGRVAVRPDLTFPLPDEISFRSGAGIPMTYLTAHLALTRRCRVEAGQVVLVHGAAGGLGTALVQCAKALGAQVIAVVSTAAKARSARAAGADAVVEVDDWGAQVRRMAPDGVDVVADPVGGDRLLDSLRCLRREGVLLVLGFAGGAIGSIAPNRLLLRNIDVRGVAWGSLIETDPDYPARQWRDVLDWVRDGHVRPVDGPAFRHTEAAAALRTLDERAGQGKVTLTFNDEGERNG